MALASRFRTPFAHLGFARPANSAQSIVGEHHTMCACVEVIPSSARSLEHVSAKRASSGASPSLTNVRVPAGKLSLRGTLRFTIAVAFLKPSPVVPTGKSNKSMSLGTVLLLVPCEDWPSDAALGSELPPPAATAAAPNSPARQRCPAVSNVCNPSTFSDRSHARPCACFPSCSLAHCRPTACRLSGLFGSMPRYIRAECTPLVLSFGPACSVSRSHTTTSPAR
mmetsp:Transcript_38243/g.88221  ORF Transcript_38243/g.88221 Transcript_38243/m.88221 type:complete len:224 (-) Transcript_38243:667-1338(-)